MVRTPAPAAGDPAIQIRDMPDAISAIRLLGSQIVAVPSVDMLVQSSPEITTAAGRNSVPTKVKEISITVKGAYRIQWLTAADTQNQSVAVQSQIYRNGSVVGALHLAPVTVAGIYTAFFEDIGGWNPGDLCQLYVYTAGATTDADAQGFGIWGEYSTKPPDIPPGVVSVNGV